MIKVLVTGKDSQLAKCIKDLKVNYPEMEFHFKSSSELDITNTDVVNKTLQKTNYNYCINCAAYTAVDKAESDTEKAISINAVGAKNIAKACKTNSTILIHVSTDFVFDGTKHLPYLETDKTNPINYYGRTKRDGENEIISILESYYIIRTSWLYSEYGNNFLKTMLKLAKSKQKLQVINDQFGSPTYAKDLAGAILHIISKNSNHFGIYHFANSGSSSWYKFAKTIFNISNLEIEIIPVTTKQYGSTTDRPKNSVLSINKIKNTFNFTVKDWEVSLKEAIHNLSKQA